MKLKKSEKILLSVLVTVLNYFLMDTFILSSDEPKPVSKPAAVSKQKATSQKQDEKGIINKNMMTIQPLVKRVSHVQALDPELMLNWKRDPFLGAFTSAMLDSLRQDVKDSSLVLKAISWRDSIAYVIINDDVYREGESKNGIKVLRVVNEQVFCRKNGKHYILSFGE